MAVLLILMIEGNMIVPCFASPAVYMNIKTLAEQSATRWQGEYQSVRGETVSVDCPVIVPDADMAPVLRVIWYPPLDQAFLNEFGAPSEDDIHRFHANTDDTTTAVIHNLENMTAPNEIGNSFDAYRFIKLEEVDWDRIYARNSLLTAREAFEAIENRIKEIYTKYGSYGYYPMEPAYGFKISYLVDKTGTPTRDIDKYSFFGFEVMRGLPVVGIIPHTYMDISKHRFESIDDPRYYILHIETEFTFGFAAHLLAEEELIHEDIPLVDFEIAKPQVEKLIEDGRVRKVHGVRLGYILYLEPDHNREHFRLVPSWVVDCEYYKTAKDETEVIDEPDYTIVQNFRKLTINAQTGKLIDPENKSPDRSDYPEIITWDDVKQEE